MTAKKSPLIIAIAFLAIPPFLPAQQPPVPPSPFAPASPPKVADSLKPAVFYRLNFAIREMEGDKLLDTRNYSLWAQTGRSEKMTAGSEVPYASSSSTMSYRKVGVSINCTLTETDGNLSLWLNLEMSGVAPSEKSADPGMQLMQVVFRSVSFSADAALIPGRSTMIGSVDDPATKRRFQVDVTATKTK
jgi:hypothetical protein